MKKYALFLLLMLIGCEALKPSPGFWQDVGRTYGAAVQAGYPRPMATPYIPPQVHCQTYDPGTGVTSTRCYQY